MNEPRRFSCIRQLVLFLSSATALQAGLVLGCSDNNGGSGDANSTTSTSAGSSGTARTSGGSVGKGGTQSAGGTTNKTTGTTGTTNVSNGGTQATAGGNTAQGGASQSSPRGGSGTEDTAAGGSSTSTNSSTSSSGTGSTGGSSPATNASGGTSSTVSAVSSGGTSPASGGTQSSVTMAPTGGGANVAVSATKKGEGQIALSGLTDVSYGGYLNGESFQQDGIVSYNGYQYTAFWNTNRQVVMARRKLPNGAWSKFDFTDYTNSEKDAHNTISLGITPGDGTLHLSFDHHSTILKYRVSVANLVTDPENVAWAAASFGSVKNALVAGTNVTLVTYPRFVTEPGGQKMLFSARIGESGSGDEYLWEYSAASHTWTSLGKYIDGISNSINAYLHNLAYTRGGTRLHASWCWRDTSNASTNHDLLYTYSDDHGRTWKNNAGAQIGTSGTTSINLNSTGLNVWPIKTNRGLINQEHMAIDSLGRVHVLLGHMPDSEADNSTFDTARAKSQYFHYWRDTSGKWTRTSIAGLAVVKNFRGKLAIASSNNVYAILPGMRIAAASASSNFASWSLLTTDTSRAYFSDPLIDSARVESEDALTVYYPQESSVNIWALEYTIQ